MTLEELKDQLPNVKVKLSSGKIVEGQVKGRKLAFPVVYVNVEGTDLPIQVSWACLLNCVNSGKPIIA